jgi:hypothetical protein
MDNLRTLIRKREERDGTRYAMLVGDGDPAGCLVMTRDGPQLMSSATKSVRPLNDEERAMFADDIKTYIHSRAVDYMYDERFRGPPPYVESQLEDMCLDLKELGYNITT